MTGKYWKIETNRVQSGNAFKEIKILKIIAIINF